MSQPESSEQRASRVPESLHRALVDAAERPGALEAGRQACAKLHRERPDMIGADCHCPTCRPEGRRS